MAMIASGSGLRVAAEIGSIASNTDSLGVGPLATDNAALLLVRLAPLRSASRPAAGVEQTIVSGGPPKPNAAHPLSLSRFKPSAGFASKSVSALLQLRSRLPSSRWSLTVPAAPRCYESLPGPAEQTG